MTHQRLGKAAAEFGLSATPLAVLVKPHLRPIIEEDCIPTLHGAGF
jgi:hypothetical protein